MRAIIRPPCRRPPARRPLRCTDPRAALGLHQTTLYRWARAGVIPARHVGNGHGHYVFDWAVIEEMRARMARR
jgi:hypothetical protein